MPKNEFAFSEVEELAVDAHLWYKEAKFRPSQGEKLVGYAPPMPIYNWTLQVYSNNSRTYGYVTISC